MRAEKRLQEEGKKLCTHPGGRVQNCKISIRQLVRKWWSMGNYLFIEVLTVSKPDIISGESWVRGWEEKEEVGWNWTERRLRHNLSTLKEVQSWGWDRPANSCPLQIPATLHTPWLSIELSPTVLWGLSVTPSFKWALRLPWAESVPLLGILHRFYHRAMLIVDAQERLSNWWNLLLQYQQNLGRMQKGFREQASIVVVCVFLFLIGCSLDKKCISWHILYFQILGKAESRLVNSPP